LWVRLATWVPFFDDGESRVCFLQKCSRPGASRGGWRRGSWRRGVRDCPPSAPSTPEPHPQSRWDAERTSPGEYIHITAKERHHANAAHTVDAIIFLAPIAGFDQVLAEDRTVNRLVRGISLPCSCFSMVTRRDETQRVCCALGVRALFSTLRGPRLSDLLPYARDPSILPVASALSTSPTTCN
jgi:hypothetical protein